MHPAKLALIIFVVIISSCDCHNKYSKEANRPQTNLADRPFRMAKINLVYEKAQKRLGASKLQALFKDLQDQDKIEIALKKLRSENQDKDGLKEMETRSKLNVILAKYDLRDVLEAVNEDKKPMEPSHQKQLFKDKFNLDRLWNKALESKFSEEELKVLKEEFQHYEKKLEDYHELVDKVHELEEKVKHEQERWENSVERLDTEHEFSKPSGADHLQHLNDQHRSVKDSYFKLQDKVLGNEKIELDPTRLFEEDDAQTLWKAAQNANFEETELEIIKRELFHFEHRIKKLNHLHELTGGDEFENKFKSTMEYMDENKLLKNRIKELTEQVEKLRSGIESRIVSRHSEL